MDTTAASVHRPIFRNVAHHLFDNYLSGSTPDFGLAGAGTPGRCHTAGIMAHHRTFVPGFALFLSALGLLYHSFKALLYAARLVWMPTLVRNLACAGVVGAMAAWPMLNPAPVLAVPAVQTLLAGYEHADGRWARLRAEWMINSQRYLHGVTAHAYQRWHAITGIAFTAPNRDLLSVTFEPTEAQRASCRYLSRFSEESDVASAVDSRLVALIKSNSNLCAPKPHASEPARP